MGASGDEVPRMLGSYEPIMKRFIDGDISAQDFEDRYLATFKLDKHQVPGREFDVLDGLFADVDDYVADPALRAEVGGLDDEQLREKVRRAYHVLFGVGEG